MPSSPIKDLSPCIVIWDDDGAQELQLSPSFGGVLFRDEVLGVDVKEDQQGETIVDTVHTGRVVEVTVPMTRSTLAQLENAIKGSVDSATNLKVSNKVGVNVFPLSRELLLQPIEDGIAAATSTWLHVHRTYPFSNLEWTFNNEGQRITNVIFKAYPDDKTGQVNEMWRVGLAS